MAKNRASDENPTEQNETEQQQEKYSEEHNLFPETHGIEPHIYHRRWVTLAVANISLIMIVMAIS